MSLTLNPFGLMPHLHQSGTLRPAPTPGTLAAAYATNLFQNTAVAVNSSDGNIIIAVVGSTNRLVGSMQGVEYTPLNGRRVVSNFWPASTAFIAGQLTLWYTRDPWMTYLIQADGPITQAMLGNQAPLNAETGNTTTGFSTESLASASVTSSANAQLRIVGFWQDVNNAPGDAFTVVQVQISQHQDVANQVAY